MIKRKVVEPEGEYLLLGSMIMSRSVLSSAYNRYKTGELKTQHFTQGFRPIFRWIISYYKKHNKAPKKTIGEVFKRKKKRLSKESQEIIEEYLDTIADKYASSDIADPDYVRNEILTDFIRERELGLRIDKAQSKMDIGDFTSAEKIITEVKKVTDEEEDEELGTIIPLSLDELDKNGFDEGIGEPVYRFDGDLGKLVGPLCKSWLVAVTGVEKSGKSYLLQEIAMDAAIYQRKKVLIINLELNKKTVRNRQRRRFTNRANPEDSGRLIYPILDCANNQFKTCRVLKRLPNKRALFKNDMDVISWFKRKEWLICDKCRESTRKNAARNKRFVPAPWFERERIRKLTEKSLRASLNRNKTLPLKNIRTKCFPRYSVTFDETYDYIMRYVEKKKWMPHIIIYDYLDILAKEHKETRIDIDNKWKKASKLAGELDCLVLSADQATKVSRTQYSLDQMSTSESKTKDSHLDVRIALNQVPDEKSLGIARIGVLFHRHSSFDTKNEVMITQRLATAEPLMDNAFLYDRGKKIRVTNKKF